MIFSIWYSSLVILGYITLSEAVTSFLINNNWIKFLNTYFYHTRCSYTTFEQMLLTNVNFIFKKCLKEK